MGNLTIAIKGKCKNVPEGVVLLEDICAIKDNTLSLNYIVYSHMALLLIAGETLMTPTTPFFYSFIYLLFWALYFPPCFEKKNVPQHFNHHSSHPARGMSISVTIQSCY